MLMPHHRNASVQYIHVHGNECKYLYDDKNAITGFLLTFAFVTDGFVFSFCNRVKVNGENLAFFSANGTIYIFRDIYLMRFFWALNWTVE